MDFYKFKLNNIFMINQPEEIITKESIDQEIAEKAMVDVKILEVLENIELLLVVALVCFMIYLTVKKVMEYLKRKRREQEELLEKQQRDLMKNYEENKEIK